MNATVWNCIVKDKSSHFQFNYLVQEGSDDSCELVFFAAEAIAAFV